MANSSRFHIPNIQVFSPPGPSSTITGTKSSDFRVHGSGAGSKTVVQLANKAAGRKATRLHDSS
ncbi:hypothetical protein KSP39_PZI004497 [Platanthera zijinensis]|uniref:Uncharacterized protein n=1 Tax=Platanthera zijinensis TaxID=2320716 RepID=A0AAP0BVC1_9ASPA